MSNIRINNREYRLKIFREKVYNSTIKVLSDSHSNKMEENNIINKEVNRAIKCPHCKNEEIIKYGFYSGKQRYKCKNNTCERTFTAQSESPFRHSKKFREKCEEYKELFEKGLTIRQCAERLNITVVTSFFWRHRFLYDLKHVNYVEKLCNYAELTRIVIIENFKGDRRMRNKEKGKISIVNGMNKSVEIISIVAARNHLGLYELRDNIAPRIDKKAVAVAFLDGRLQAFSDKHNRINKITIRKVDITPIDRMYSLRLKRWLVKFRGVATKYIDHYLSWRAYEYKNNIENDSMINKEEIMSLKINVFTKVTTYISWNNIKAKVVAV